MAQGAQDLEALGAFYLGRRVEEDGTRSDDALLYKAKDLTTHGVAVGMTGSGKTGLSVVLLEEAAIDGIPAIVIDPKGDMGNLLLTFPGLTGAEFAPYVDPAEAERHGHTPEEEATAIARKWKEGLAGWGQDGARIERFANSVERVLYTPGSESGRPLAVLGGFAPPAGDVDPEALREEAVASASALCALVDLDPDPVTSREHILMSRLLFDALSAGRALSLVDLIRQIMDPPFDTVGALPLSDFFPADDRKKLGMRLNNLLASPGFASWMKGEPLDVERLLYAPDGRPRLSILSIAHLSERERMFFVTILLSRILSWVRKQPGTSSLRALLFMDEVFGFFPPVAEPPSKKPMLTLLKQARAYGLGILLSTQNPVDLDYKGLSNCGTWFLGRLSTERDIERVIDGLSGASASGGPAFDRQEVARTLAGLGPRRFLMRNVHERAPVVLETRWALSYLRGPLTRAQLSGLVARGDAAEPKRPAPAAAGVVAEAAPDPGAPRPVLDPDIVQRFVQSNDASASRLRPHVLGVARLHHTHRASGLDSWTTVGRVAVLADSASQTWQNAEAVRPDALPLIEEPVGGDAAGYLPVPRFVTDKRGWASLEKALAANLYEAATEKVYRCDEAKAWSNPGESQAAFVARMELRAREARDEALDKLEGKYQKDLERLEDKVRRAREKVSREQDQHTAKKIDTAVSVGSTVLGALFGRRVLGKATTAARGAGRMSREAGDVRRAEEALRDAEEDLADLQIEVDAELTRLRASPITAPPITDRTVTPTKKDIEIASLILVWVPEAG